jgi:hypothetical protein
MNQLTITRPGLKMRFVSIPNLLSVLLQALILFITFSFESLRVMAFLFKKSNVEEVFKSTVYLLASITMDDRNIDFALVCQDRLARSIALHSPKVENS